MTQEFESEQIKPDQFNMIILDFLKNHPLDFWNVNEIASKAAGIKGLNNTRVKKSIIYFANKNFVLEFSNLPIEDQKRIRRKSTKDIRSESYQITDFGKEIHKKITESCLDPVGQHLLSFKKIE